MLVVSKGLSPPAALAFYFFILMICSVSALAAEPGRGATRELEQNYLRSIIDHHFSALRMTELAAGTDQGLQAEIIPNDGTHPSPGFPATDARAQSNEIKSLARRNNRMQREEILTAQRFLRDWYGITHEPQIPTEARADIERLQAVSGDEFDHLFIEILSRHHYMAVISSVDCLVGRELRHDKLRRYCQGIVDSQLNDIDELRHMACEQHDRCDLQPQSPGE